VAQVRTPLDDSGRRAAAVGEGARQGRQSLALAAGEGRLMRRLAACSLVMAAAALAVPSGAAAKITTLALPGSAPGEVKRPEAIAVEPDGDVVVVEAGNARGQRFTSAGASAMTFGGIGTSPGKLGDGGGFGMRLAIGLQGDYYVVVSTYINRFRPDGTFVGRWSTEDLPDPSLAGPIQGIAVLGAGDVYAVSRERVLRFSADGQYLGVWGLTNAAGAPAQGLDAAGAGDRLYVLAHDGAGARFVAAYDGAGAVLGRWSGGRRDPFSDAGTMEGITGIGLDAEGNVLAAGNSGISKFGPLGSYMGTWPPRVRDSIGPSFSSCGLYRTSYQLTGGLPSGARDVAGDAAGNLWFVEEGSALRRLDTEPDIPLDWGPEVGFLAPGMFVRLEAPDTVVAFGAPVRFEWDFDGDGTFEQDTGTVPRARHAYAQPGTYVARVRVTGPGGTVGQRAHTFTVRPWRPSFYKPDYVLTGEAALLDAQPSELSCSPIERYEWDLDGDGAFETDTGTSRFASARFARPGKNPVGIRVTREGGRVDTNVLHQSVYLMPPPGAVGVSINRGARYTNSRDVEVKLVWRRYMAWAMLSNDGGFKRGKTFAVAESIPWRLAPARSGRLPSVVYARFGTPIAEMPAITYQDDIVLDEVAPVVLDARAGGGELSLRARDRTSGVARMQIAPSPREPGRWLRFARRVQVPDAAAAAIVRVRDRAGNRSRWRAVEPRQPR
jgi:hypothetical protein